MSMQSFEVPPLSREDLFSLARSVRATLKMNKDYLPVMHILEVVLPKMYPDYHFAVLGSAVMGNNHGLTVPSENAIYLREDVYDGAVAGNGRDRFTACHELGHYLLHRNVQMKFHRSTEKIKPYLDSEWQANTFASALLMDEGGMLTCRSIDEVMNRFGVSYAAATIRNKALSNLGKMSVLN